MLWVLAWLGCVDADGDSAESALETAETSDTVETSDTEEAAETSETNETSDTGETGADTDSGGAGPEDSEYSGDSDTAVSETDVFDTEIPDTDVSDTDSSDTGLPASPCGDFSALQEVGAQWEWSEALSVSWVDEALGQDGSGRYGLETRREVAPAYPGDLVSYVETQWFECDALGVWLVEMERNSTFTNSSSYLRLEYTDPMLLHPLNFQVGTVWNDALAFNRFTDQGPAGSGGHAFETTVLSAATLTVPAGSFLAYELEEVDNNGPVERFWFAEGVGMIATPDRELANFTP